MGAMHKLWSEAKDRAKKATPLMKFKSDLGPTLDEVESKAQAIGKILADLKRLDADLAEPVRKVRDAMTTYRDGLQKLVDSTKDVETKRELESLLRAIERIGDMAVSSFMDPCLEAYAKSLAIYRKLSSLQPWKPAKPLPVG
jgi:di/tripeptidase